MHSNMVCHIQDNEDKYIAAELQIKGGIKDNSKVIFIISQPKHTLSHH